MAQLRDIKINEISPRKNMTQTNHGLLSIQLAWSTIAI